MNEMKPEDVMKALECWVSKKPCEEDCPILEYEGSHNCLALTMKNALSLLREKDARIKELEEAVCAEFTCFVGDPHKVDHCPYVDELVKKDAEIERLQGALKAEERHNELTMETAQKALVKKDAEIAMLTEDNERLHASCTELERNRASLNDDNERLKVELKKRPPKLIITKLNKKDQIAKEMEEGKDDDHKGG
jgi:hypothetical protein